MKTLKTIATAITMFTAFATTTNAQTVTHLREVNLTEFNKIQVSLDTEVIVLKSKRNHVTLVGDSSYIAGIPVLVEEGTLEFNYATEPDNMLKKVVIEYTDLNHVTTGGKGTYYFHNIEEDRLVVFNPYANVVLTGTTEDIRVVSQEGVTDVTAFSSKKEAMYIGESAMLVTNATN